MGLWEEKNAKPKPQLDPKENPFDEWFLTREFPYFWDEIYKFMFDKQKSNLLLPGEKVRRYWFPAKLSRVILADEQFHKLAVFDDPDTFEDDFYFSEFYSLGYAKDGIKYPNLGIVPVFARHREFMWRIKTCHEELSLKVWWILLLYPLVIQQKKRMELELELNHAALESFCHCTLALFLLKFRRKIVSTSGGKNSP